jgi:hypothetical protein
MSSTMRKVCVISTKNVPTTMPFIWRNRRRRRWLVLAGASANCVAATLVFPANAETIDDLQRKLQQLQSRLESLEAVERGADDDRRQAAKAARAAKAAQVNAEAAQAQAEAARNKVQDAQARARTDGDPLQGSLPGSIRIPGTNTSVKLYGFAKAHLYGDVGPRNRSDTITVPSIPLTNSALGARTPGDVTVGARYSRLNLETLTPFDERFGSVRTLFEADFAGQTTDLTTQAGTSNFTTRLRLALGEFGKLDGWGTVLVGQAYSLYSEAPINPLRSVTDWTMPGTSSIRQGAFQYNKGFGATTISLGIENSYSDITSTAGASFPDSNGGAGFGWSRIPDFTARAMWRGEDGFVALRGVVRDIGINNESAAPLQRYTASVVGYGVGATGAVNFLDKRMTLFSTVNYGDGVGRYLSTISSGLGAITNFGLPGVAAQTARLDSVRAVAGLVGVQYKFLPNLQSNVTLAGASLDYPNYASGFTTTQGSINRNLWATSVNLIYSPVPAVDVGIEYQHAERTLLVPDVNGATGGVADRIQSMGLVRF